MAVASIRAALKVDPWAADLHRALAGYLYSLDDKAGAEKEAGKVAEITRNPHVELRVFQTR